MDNNKNLSEMSIVTEIGSFGSLNIEDPTVTKVKTKDTEGDDELNALIQESIQNNLNIGL